MTTSEDHDAGVTSLRHSSRAKRPSRRAEEMHLAEKVGEKLDLRAKKGASGGKKLAVKSKKKKEERPSKDEDDGGEYEQDEEEAGSEDVQEQDGVEEEEEAEGNGGDEKGAEAEVFCLCRKGDDGRPMVFCAECNDWFHFKCVNLSKRKAEMLSEYICPTCSDRTGKRSKNIDDQESSGASASPFHDDSEQSASPPRRPSGPSKRKSMEEESVRKRSRGEFPEATPRKTSISTVSSGSHPVEPSRKTSVSTSAPSGSIAVAKARSETLRKHAVDQLKSTFESIFAEGIQDESERKRRIDDYATEFEEILFETHNESVPKMTTRMAGKVYRDRLRSYLFNLKDKGNTGLRQKIASGELAASDLAIMSNDELANDDIRKEVERRKRENLEQSILKKEKAPLRKLTHKGEIDIEYEATQNTRVAEEQRDQIDKDKLNVKPEKGSESSAMSPPAVPRIPAAKTSPINATNPRRISTSLQSPTMSFDFDNVWNAAEVNQEPKEGENQEDEEVVEEESTEKKDDKDGHHEEAAGDDFIDNFLGMADEAEGKVQGEIVEQLQQIASEQSDGDIKWRGTMSMFETGMFTAKIRQIAGRPMLPHEWGALFPSSHSLIKGRLPSNMATPYLEQSRQTLSTELVVMSMHLSWESELIKDASSTGPINEDDNKDAFHKLMSYFVERDRYGVLTTHPSAEGKLVKDFYIAPLPKDATLPAWLDSCMREDALEGASLRRDADVFIVVAVLFRQQSRQQSNTPAYSPPQHVTAQAQIGSGTPPSSNLNTLLGAGGSNTLQDLLKAVGGNNRAPSIAASMHENGGQQQGISLSSQHPSIEALSEMPKPQLEDMLQKNPTLVDELLKTLAGSKSTSPRPPGPPPGPPPPQPTILHGGSQPPARPMQYSNNPYVNSHQQQHTHVQRPPSSYPYGANNYGIAGMQHSRPMQSIYHNQPMPGGMDQDWHQNPNYYGRPNDGYASPPGGYGPAVRGGDQRGPAAYHQGPGRRN